MVWSCECSTFDIWVWGLVDKLDVGVDSMLYIESVNSVVAVFCLHLRVPANVNKWVVASIRFHSHFDFHHQVKRLVSLVLAVLNTEFFTGCRCEEAFCINTVQVALAEKEWWQRELCELLLAVHWVAIPVGVLHFLELIIISDVDQHWHWSFYSLYSILEICSAWAAPVVVLIGF